MIRKTLLVVMAATIQTGFALMRAYSVEPVNAAQSGWTDTIPGYDHISQTITCNWDSLKRVELFAGDTCNGGAYRLQVLTVPGGAQVAYQNAGTYSRPHHWVVFDNLTFTAPESIVKGKQYEFKFTRSGSDSIQYYYSTGNPYEYGVIGIPGMDPHPTQWDLAARVYGVMDAIDSTFWSYNVLWPDSCPDRTDRSLCFLPALPTPA